MRPRNNFEVPIVGETRGEWTVLTVIPPGERRTTHVVARCSCGEQKTVGWHEMKRGGTLTCGYRTRHRDRFPLRTHGQSETSLYSRWHLMVERCTDLNAKSWSDYGGRGITVCAAWAVDFRAFRDWAVLNGYDPGLQIDRIDNDGPYAPENCRWVTRTENAQNRRNSVLLCAFGATKTLAAWVRDPICKVGAATVRRRLAAGMPVERALTTEARRPWDLAKNRVSA